MKSKLKLKYLPNSVFIFSIFQFVIFTHTTKAQSQSQYHNAADYSTLSQSDPISVLNTDLNYSNGAAAKVDLTQSSSYQTAGNEPQGAGGQSVYYYEMYPSGSKHKQLCTSGMKCKRDSSTSSNNGYSTDTFDNTGTVDSYSPYASSYINPSNNYGNPNRPQIGNRQEFFNDNLGPTGTTGTSTEGGSLGGLGGLAGLLGLTGLKSLIPYALIIPFAPVLIPLVILLLLLPILPFLLLIPIPVIVSPPPLAARSTGEAYLRSVSLKSMLRIAANVLDSEECVQKLSCEINKMSRKYNVSNWTERITKALPKNNPYANKVRQGIMRNSTLILNEDKNRKPVEELDGECSVFSCKPGTTAAKYFKY